MSDCVFCRIIAGEIPSATVFEDKDFKAIMDIAPAAKGHIIILSKKHYANLYELEDSVASKALIVARRIAQAMKEELKCDGINILQNNGEAAGQTVFHFHIHVMPRYNDDHVIVPWTNQKYEDGEAAAIAAAIAARVS